MIALRELALRQTADRVDDQMREYRVDEAIEQVWKTREGVLACVGPRPGAECTVRSASRLAKQLDAPWHAVYLTKPFGVGELVARVRALLRRRIKAFDSSVVVFGDIKVDLVTRRVERSCRVVHLTPIEYRLLASLLSNPDKVLTHKQLLIQVWGPSYSEQIHYVRIFMGHLREQLERDPAQPTYLITEPGVGYRFAST